MTMRTEAHLATVEIPANLRINDQIQRFREACRRMGCRRPYHHFAFGQSPFSPPPSVVEALRAHAGEHGYLPTAGLPALRETVARYYEHHFRMTVAPEQVVVSPGSKEMIAMLLTALEGRVLVPIPSWVSYMPQAAILRKEVVPLRLHASEGFKLTPERLRHGIEKAAGSPSILILNHPHNPTGAVYDRGELETLAEVCRTHGVAVISDEIYARTAFDPEAFTSMGEVYPEGTIVTGGLSKDRGAGGYRVGVGIFPAREKQLLSDVLISASTSMASATMSSGKPRMTEVRNPKENTFVLRRVAHQTPTGNASAQAAARALAPSTSVFMARPHTSGATAMP